jgi:hypothetical protein
MKRAGDETFGTLTASGDVITIDGYETDVASLDAVYRMKKAANRAKDDRAVLHLMEAKLRERSKNEG